MRRATLSLLIAAIVLLFLAASGRAQELGPEITVAPLASEYVLAGGEEAGFLVAWSADAGPVTQLFGRRYDSSGAPLGAAVVLARVLGGEAGFLAATAVAKGEYVVAWSRPVGGAERIFARRIGPHGLGRAKDIGAAPTAVTGGLAITGIGGGEWASAVAFPRSGAPFGFGAIWATLRSVSSAPRGTLRVTPSGFAPAMAANVDGTFLVAHRTARPGHPETIVCQLRDRDGGLLASTRVRLTEFDISSTPLLAASGTGRFVVGWIEGQALWLRFFKPLMKPIGEPIDTGAEGSSAALAMDPSGSVLAAYSLASEFNASPILGRRFDADGSPEGAEFQVAISNGPPVAAALGASRFIVVWRQGDALRARIVRWLS